MVSCEVKCHEFNLNVNQSCHRLKGALIIIYLAAQTVKCWMVISSREAGSTARGKRYMKDFIFLENYNMG